MARARATRCRCPPDNWCGRLRAVSVSPTVASTSVTRSRTSARGSRSRSSPYAMFLSMFMCGNRAYDWNIRLTGRRCAGTPRRSRPSRVTVPLSGVSKPARTRSRVVFPQPLGPRRAKNSPPLDVQAHPVQSGDLAEPPGDVMDPDHSASVSRLIRCAAITTVKLTASRQVARALISGVTPNLIIE